MITMTSSTIPTTSLSMNDYIARRVSYWTGKLTKQLHLSKHDAEDFQQEMYVEVYNAMQRFNSDHSGQRTFISHVLNRFAKKLIRNVMRQRRNPTVLATSLAGVREPMTNDPSQGTPLETQQVDLRLDLETFHQSLSPRLKQVAQLLTEHSPTQVAQELGWNRSSVSRAMSQLRDKLTEAGFEPGDLFPR